MTQPWFWKKIWAKVVDYEYDIDHAVFEAVEACKKRGGEVTDQTMLTVVAHLGYSPSIARASFDRLRHCGAVRYERYSPGASSYFAHKKGKDRIRRTPLGGKRFRSPREFGEWGRPSGAISFKGQAASFAEALGQSDAQFTFAKDGVSRHKRVAIPLPRHEAPFDLKRFTENMHPRVRAFCEGMADGLSPEAAREEAGLTEGQFQVVLPRLREALAGVL